MMKKLLSLTVILAMLMSTFGVLNVLGDFQNVSEWAITEVEEALNNGLIPHEMLYDDLTKNISRAEFAAVAVKLYEKMTGKEIPTERVLISDIDGNEYYGYITKAYIAGITTGTSMAPVMFSPDLDITREQLATMLCRTVKKYKYFEWTNDSDYQYVFDSYDDNTFDDDYLISSYARQSVYYMSKYDITKGVGENNFAPGETATREQALLMALRIFKSKTDFDLKKIELSGYELAYSTYVKNCIPDDDYNDGDFSRGIMICDLNEDGIPELFSVAYGTEIGDTVRFYQYKNGEVVAPTENSPQTYINIDSIIGSQTFYMSPRNFFGVYRNKITGEKAIINSILYDDIEVFDIITYDGNEFSVIDESVKNKADAGMGVDEKRDYVMNNYELVSDDIYSSVLLRGTYDGVSAFLDMAELFEDFNSPKQTDDLNVVPDGEFECYVKNIDFTKNEIELIPVSYITYEEYEECIKNDTFFVLNGEETKILYDEYMANEFGVAGIYQMPWYEYSFEIPTPDFPKSVINGYVSNEPVKVKFGDDFKVRYGVLGYDDEGIPFGYETLGRNKEYTIFEYLLHFAEYCMGGHYKATIKDNTIVLLDVLYRP